MDTIDTKTLDSIDSTKVAIDPVNVIKEVDKTFKMKSKSSDKILAKFIYAFHLFVVIFVIFGPLLNSVPLLLLHAVFSFGLLVHWIANSDVCSLSMFEAQMNGIPYNQTFMHRLVSPMYNIDQMVLSKLVKITTLILCIFSIFKISQSERFYKLLDSVKTNGLFHDKTLYLFQIDFQNIF